MRSVLSLKNLRKLILFVLCLIVFVVLGCGSDPKTLVKDGIENKSGSKISEVYNNKKEDEKNKFAKEVTVAYFEQAKVDMAQKFKPDFNHYKLDDSIGDLLSHIDSGDSNFINLRKLHKLFERRRANGEQIFELHNRLGLGTNQGDLRYDNAGPIDEYTLYIFHKVPFSGLQPVYAAIGYQVIGDEYFGRHVMPDVNNYLAMVHVPQNGSFFTQGQGVYTFYAARAGEVKFKDPAGFERNLPLLQLIPDGQVEAVRQFIRLHKKRKDMDVIIPQFINNVLTDPGGEFKTGVFSVDIIKPKISMDTSSSNAQGSEKASLAPVGAIDKSFLGEWKGTKPKGNSLTIKEGNPQTGGYELEISFYRIASAKAYANIDGNKLSINQGDIGGRKFRGTIEKTNSGIRLTITESAFEHVKPGSIYEFGK